jgi:hypothetical protein
MYEKGRSDEESSLLEMDLNEIVEAGALWRLAT